jgi:hypothetical protein
MPRTCLNKIIAVFAIVLVGFFTVGSLLLTAPTKAAATQWKPFAYLNQHGVTQLKNGVQYDIGNGYTMSIMAVNGKGTPINVDLSQQNGAWIDTGEAYADIFAHKAKGNAVSAAAVKETEDVTATMTFTAGIGLPPLKIVDGIGLDNDPKPNSAGMEQGAIFTTATGDFIVPISPPNVNNQVAKVAINQQVSWLRYTSEDSWHFTFVVETELSATATPTNTSSPTTTASPAPTSTVTATPVMTDTHSSVYLPLFKGGPGPKPIATPKASPTPKSCKKPTATPEQPQPTATVGQPTSTPRPLATPTDQPAFMEACH